MVSNASDDLPDPDSPVTTLRALCGISTSMFLRLWVRAPRTTMLALDCDAPMLGGSMLLLERTVDIGVVPGRGRPGNNGSPRNSTWWTGHQKASARLPNLSIIRCAEGVGTSADDLHCAAPLEQELLKLGV